MCIMGYFGVWVGFLKEDCLLVVRLLNIMGDINFDDYCILISGGNRCFGVEVFWLMFCVVKVNCGEDVGYM